MRKKLFIGLSIAMMLSLSSCGQNQITQISEAITEPTEKRPTETTTEQPSDDINVIDKFIELYNAISSNAIADVTEMDIHGDDYRTEFRLAAFDNATGVNASINGETISILNYGILKNDSIRIYFSSQSLDTAIDVITTAVHVFDDSISDKEIEKQFESFDTTNEANIYLGDTGYISGYVNTSHNNEQITQYDVMIDCTDLKNIIE